MTRSIAVPLFLVSVVSLAAVPANAQDLGYESWGMRIGTTASPGAVALGAEVDFGRLTDRLRLVPALDLGLTSDTTVLSLSLPVHFLITETGELRPYVGGGVVVTALDLEDAREDEDDFDAGAFVLLGGELVRGRSAVFGEASLATGDAYTGKLVVGWRF